MFNTVERDGDEIKNLEDLLKRLQLSEVKDTVIELKEEVGNDVTRKGDLWLIGKVWVERSIGNNIIGGIMAKVWRLSRKA